MKNSEIIKIYTIDNSDRHPVFSTKKQAKEYINSLVSALVCNHDVIKITYSSKYELLSCEIV